MLSNTVGKVDTHSYYPLDKYTNLLAITDK